MLIFKNLFFSNSSNLSIVNLYLFINSLTLYRIIPEAMATFNDSALPYIGMITVSSATFKKLSLTPFPSLPKIIALFSLNVISVYSIELFSRAVTRNLYFFFFIYWISWSSSIYTIFILNIEPILLLTHFSL